MSDQQLILNRPDNVWGRFGQYVTHDVFHIAERLQEISPNLFIQALPETQQFGEHMWNFAIIEWVPRATPPEQLVYRTEALDGRIIEHVEYLRRVPLSVRLREMERIEEKRKEEDQQRELDELYDRMGRAMWYQLEHDGFNEGRGVSFPKRGIHPTREKKLWLPS